jgi:hypothetical protein
MYIWWVTLAKYEIVDVLNNLGARIFKHLYNLRPFDVIVGPYVDIAFDLVTGRDRAAQAKQIPGWLQKALPPAGFGVP